VQRKSGVSKNVMVIISIFAEIYKTYENRNYHIRDSCNGTDSNIHAYVRVAAVAEIY
jgi:hypothetical protein